MSSFDLAVKVLNNGVLNNGFTFLLPKIEELVLLYCVIESSKSVGDSKL